MLEDYNRREAISRVLYIDLTYIKWCTIRRTRKNITRNIYIRDCADSIIAVLQPYAGKIKSNKVLKNMSLN